ncbi:hypothetical protein [Methylotenera sp.]|uniref:hypothetical protein n=1 Tax=Methylotenera sp. TaxID=2051956 RepID=UPI0025E05B6E|nr:hypothetical protein [Methylotenera sp.]
MDTHFLLWALPIAGYLIALSVDAGYLSYFDIPLTFVELNLYSAAFSALFLILLMGGCSFILFGVMSLEERKHFIFPAIFNRDSAILALTLLVFSFFIDEVPISASMIVYLLMIIVRIIEKIFDRKSDLPLTDRLRLKDAPEPKSEKSSEKTPLNKLGRFLDHGFSIILLLGVAFAIGNKVAHYQLWSIKGHERSVVIPRNNNMFIEKKYDQEYILDRENKLIFASEESVTIVPLEKSPPLITHDQAKLKRKKNEKKS